MTQEQDSPKRTDLTQFNSSPNLEGAATWTGGPAIIHQNVVLLKCVSEVVLEEALVATDLKYNVVRRISPTTVIINDENIDELVKTLTKRGYEPKIIQSPDRKS